MENTPLKIEIITLISIYKKINVSWQKKLNIFDYWSLITLRVSEQNYSVLFGNLGIMQSSTYYLKPEAVDPDFGSASPHSQCGTS